MQYEVFIPSLKASGYDTTLTVEAENWMSALKTGLERCGEAPDIVRNVMCDIQADNTIHVTDAATRRVFRLRELDGIVSSEPPPPAAAPAPPAPAEGDTIVMAVVSAPEVEAPQPPTVPMSRPAPPTPQAAPARLQPRSAPSHASKPPQPARPPGGAPLSSTATTPANTPEIVAGKPTAMMQAPDAAELRRAAEAHRARRGQPPEPPLSRSNSAAAGASSSGQIGSRQLGVKTESSSKVIAVKKTKTGELQQVDIGRISEVQQVAETAIEDVFLEIYDIFDRQMSLEQAVNYVLDLAMDKIGAEHGSVLFATPDGAQLYCAAARGPYGGAMKNKRIPMGTGIAGFCCYEGVSLAISDAQRDPRFQEDISKDIGAAAQSVLCTPVQFQGRVYGCVELVNKNARSDFAPSEVNVLGYIGHQLGKFVHQMLTKDD